VEEEKEEQTRASGRVSVSSRLLSQQRRFYYYFFGFSCGTCCCCVGGNLRSPLRLLQGRRSRGGGCHEHRRGRPQACLIPAPSTLSFALALVSQAVSLAPPFFVFLQSRSLLLFSFFCLELGRSPVSLPTCFTFCKT
jgi:hypothetical protein